MTKGKEDDAGALPSDSAWSERLQSIISKIGAKTAKCPTEEIEADISEAVEEVRKARDTKAT